MKLSSQTTRKQDLLQCIISYLIWRVCNSECFPDSCHFLRCLDNCPLLKRRQRMEKNIFAAWKIVYVTQRNGLTQDRISFAEMFQFTNVHFLFIHKTPAPISLNNFTSAARNFSRSRWLLVLRDGRFSASLTRKLFLTVELSTNLRKVSQIDRSLVSLRI